jgi:nicotinate-nucleotide pyrophosphorylase (carboxylating)
MKKKDYRDLVVRALAEDLGENGDVTSKALFADKEKSSFALYAKDDGVLCGIDVFETVFRILDKDAQVERFFEDGAALKKGDVVARVRGKLLALLAGERTALNFVSHLSGIATKAARFARAAGAKPTVLDTRKTIPGLRLLQKYAVACGGGGNHRMGLHDMILIKDNHIDAAGSITRAVDLARKKWKRRFKIEVETRNLDEVAEALRCEADRIMLDNMDDQTMREAVAMIGGKAETEASGNMTIERLPALSAIGVDFVSFGELTHTVTAFDFSLKQEKNR